jgi:hypothetical protein
LLKKQAKKKSKNIFKSLFRDKSVTILICNDSPEKTVTLNFSDLLLKSENGMKFYKIQILKFFLIFPYITKKRHVLIGFPKKWGPRP